MKRWICPTCLAGKLAPEKPRKNDTRRYCLPCSESTGRLVERTCPALNRRRRDRAVALTVTRQRKATTDRDRENARVTFNGVHVLDEAAKLWRTPALREARKVHHSGRKDLPRIEVKRAKWMKGRATAWTFEWRISVIFSDTTTPEQIRETLLHELAHICAPSREHHGATFKRLLCAAAREAFGVSVRVSDCRRAYGLDHLILAEMRKIATATPTGDTDVPD